ncbi:DUF3119 family protein [Trichothermofontia sichuanensis B231]|uniref:DUF3119 family protein n=1 Tax=Trichothermofontia sichuanensis TaxID=3045816 RepID=UPI002245EA7D|nr:DUF3119 family protein [Trichothermofontia sichuanensis]UZQ55543.1 DUF3119 family protein [Trichothermofontia sichuanensis B231]
MTGTSPTWSVSDGAIATVTLAPSFALPIALILLALPLLLVQPIASIIIALFGLFLMVQAATLRLQFTPTALDIYRGEQRIRNFPYQDWQHWQIFWPPLPILFYFREVNSIHLLPILFDPKLLQICLTQRCSVKPTL